MSRRWVCERCGSGVLGPDRPRRDDVRRYCLACSASTGRLVERTCPAIERQLAERRERAAKRATLRRERAVDAGTARRTVYGHDLGRDVLTFWRLDALTEVSRYGPERHRRIAPPTIEWRRSARKRYTSGTSYGKQIVVTLGSDLLDARVTLLHELVHSALPSGVHHGPRFWRTFRAAAREVWPAADYRFNEAPARQSGWQAHRWVVDAVRAAYYPETAT